MTRKFTILSALCCGLWLTSAAGAFQEEAGQPPKETPEANTPQRPNRPERPDRADRPQRPEGQQRPRQERPMGRPGGQPGGGPQRGGPMRDPAQMVAMMMEKFDADGDQKLNSQELTAMLTFIRERPGQVGMGGGRPGAAAEGPGGQGPRPEGRPGANRPGGKRPGAKAEEDQQNEAGGVRPRRPPAK